MRDLMLHSEQEDNYQQSSENIEKYLRVKADDSQINRLCVHYGQALECEMQEVSGAVVQVSEKFK